MGWREGPWIYMIMYNIHVSIISQCLGIATGQHLSFNSTSSSKGLSHEIDLAFDDMYG
jgi:hypothetical protein